MSDPNFTAAGPLATPSPARTDVRAAIARAAHRTGVDFDYLLAQARLESSLDPSAKAPTSSAAGLYQFTRGTWLNTLDRHGAQHGLGWADAAIEGGQLRDPATRAQVMALRYDADASALMAAELANDNRAGLSETLGREPDPPELYLAHFLGLGGARRFLSAMAAEPGQSAAALMPDAAAANRSIFYDRSGAPRSVAGVMDVIRDKVAGAMAAESGAPPTWVDYPSHIVAPAETAPVSGGPIARQFHAARLQLPAGPARPSMAETLNAAFALGSPDGASSAPAHVRTAYASLRKFGL